MVFVSKCLWGENCKYNGGNNLRKKLQEKLSDEEEYGRVLRAKGILQDAAGNWFQFDYVPGEINLRDGSADYTGRLCVIGADLNEKALTELFHL